MTDFITELRDRRILPAVGVYIASTWVLIEILDRLVERYLLSPYLTDIVFWGLYSLIPAVMLIAWTHGRKGKDKATRVEKVGVPINLIATLGLLITVFGGKDLDQAATQITVNNELGQQETHYIPSETFRRRMAVFFWNNESGNQDLDWLQYGITELLVQDLQQNPFVLASSPWSHFSNGFYSRLRRAGFNNGLAVPRSLMRKIAAEANRQYFVEGSLDKLADEYVVTARIWDTQTLEQLAELKGRNWDIYAAVDQLSKMIREELEVPESSKRIAEDMPLTETYGESEEALKAYIQGLNARLFENDFVASNAFFEKAISIDPNFVLGWFLKAVNMLSSGDLPGAQESLSKAQELDYRLPSRDRALLKSMAYQLAGENEKLMAFLKLQAQIQDDASSHFSLSTMYMVSGELEKAKTESLLALERDTLNVGIYLRMSVLERASGNMEAAIDYARNYQVHKPEDIEANLQLGDLLRDTGMLEAAEEHYKQAQLLQNEPVQPTLRLSSVAACKGDIVAAWKYLSEAESYARTPMDKTLVRQGVIQLELRLGKIHEAIKQTYTLEELLRQSQSPVNVTLSVYSPLISYYILVDNLDAARDALATATAMLQPPLDKFLAAAEALIQIKEDDFDGANASLGRTREVIEQFRVKVLEVQIHLVRAKIGEEQGEYASVADEYLQSLDLIEHSVIANALLTVMPRIYAQLATAQIETGDLVAAEKSIETGYRLDQSEPMLWVAKARLQQARKMPQLALASVNYALAIWKDADEDYVRVKEARILSSELQDTAL